MLRHIRTIKRPSSIGSLSLDDARAGPYVVRSSAKKTKGKSNAAFMKPRRPSASLAAVVGGQRMPRTEVTKKIWDYIKRNKLVQQNQKGRVISADDKLRSVFNGKAHVSMFEMTKLVNKHLK